MPEWRRLLYDDVIVLRWKAFVFYHWYYVNRYTYVVERSVSMVNDFTLNCRHIFNHSVKEHPYCSRYRINTLVANWIFFTVLGLSWVIHAWTSDFKLFSRKWKSGIVPRVGRLCTVLKPLGGVTGVLYLLCSSLILLNPIQTNFLVYHKILYAKTKNLLRTSFLIGTKYLKILHGTVVNGVQDRLSLFIILPTPNL